MSHIQFVLLSLQPKNQYFIIKDDPLFPTIENTLAQYFFNKKSEIKL